MLTAIFTAVSPYLYQIILAFVAIYLAPEIEKYLQTKADNSRREYLQDAILNGITVSKMDDPEASYTEIIEAAKQYVKLTCPTAIKELKLSDTALTEIIKVRLYMFESDYNSMIAENTLPQL